MVGLSERLPGTVPCFVLQRLLVRELADALRHLPFDPVVAHHEVIHRDVGDPYARSAPVSPLRVDALPAPARTCSIGVPHDVRRRQPTTSPRPLPTDYFRHTENRKPRNWLRVDGAALVAITSQRSSSIDHGSANYKTPWRHEEAQRN